MASIGFDIDQIVELGTQVAIGGAIRLGEIVGDDIFEYIVAIAAIVYEMEPGLP
jgi:hypothetical protein